VARDPDAHVGKKLQKFFLDLLADGSMMARYQGSAEERGALIEEYFGGDEDEGAAGARDALLTGSLQEVEAHIKQVRGSQAQPTVIVWPPM
jgi:hypothetical protein